MFKKIAAVITLGVLLAPLAWSQQEGVTPPPEAPAQSAASVPESVPAQKQEPVPAQEEARVSNWYDDIYIEIGLGYATNGGLATVSHIGKDWTIADKHQLGLFFHNSNRLSKSTELTSARGPTKTVFVMNGPGVAYSYALQRDIKLIAQATLAPGRVSRGFFADRCDEDSSSCYEGSFGDSIQYALSLGALFLLSDNLRHGAVLSYSYLSGNKYDLDIAGTSVKHKLAGNHVISLSYRYTFVGF